MIIVAQSESAVRGSSQASSRQAPDTRFRVIASRDTSLIGNDDKKVFQRLRGPTEIENTILESKGVTCVDVAALNIDNAISVQKKSLIARHRSAPADQITLLRHKTMV